MNEVAAVKEVQGHWGAALQALQEADKARESAQAS